MLGAGCLFLTAFVVCAISFSCMYCGQLRPELLWWFEFGVGGSTISPVNWTWRDIILGYLIADVSPLRYCSRSVRECQTDVVDRPLPLLLLLPLKCAVIDVVVVVYISSCVHFSGSRETFVLYMTKQADEFFILINNYY